MQKININYKTFLFDMDGVVIDSEKLHIRAMGLTLDSHGINHTASFLNQFVGSSDTSFFQFVYENMDNRICVEELIAEKNSFFKNLMHELDFVAGFPDFIQQVRKLNFQTGLVTSSSRQTVNDVNKLLNITSYFDIVITEEDTQNHKPNPEPYLLALKRLNAEKKSTLIIEDSFHGIIAGKAAGCNVVGLTTSFDVKSLQDAGADYVAANFATMKIE